MIPNSDYISDGTESTMEVALWNGWDTLNEYLNSMEGYLQKATKQFKARVNKQKKTLTPEQFNEFTIDHVEEYVYYYDEFPYILHNSFFVSAYFLLEYDIGMICRDLKDRHKIPISLSDLKPDLLKRAKLYYKLAGLDLSCDMQILQEITDYARVRHCIVHSNGLLKENDKDYKALIEYINKRGLIKKRQIISNDAEQEIGLTEKFCKEAVDTMQKFVDAVYKTSMTKGKQS